MLYVRSVAESVASYRKLGFDFADEIEGVAIVTAPGGGHLKLHPVPENGSSISEGINLYFAVGDVDAHFEQASDKGVEFEFPPTTMSWVPATATSSTPTVTPSASCRRQREPLRRGSRT